MKTCLYGKNELDLRKELRAGLSDEDIAQKIENAVQHKAIDGNQAEQQRSRVEESMATIGG
jgi:cyclic pyranopterin phosphate synthase